VPDGSLEGAVAFQSGVSRLVRIIVVGLVASLVCGAGALVYSAVSRAALPSIEEAPRPSPRPDAARLADQLSAHLKERLGRLDERSIRDGTTGRRFQRASAWYWSYWARAALTLHRVTGEPELIRTVADRIAIYRQIAEEDAAIDGFGWYTHDNETGAIYREVTVAGLVIAPMVELLLEARRDPQVAALIEGQEAQILDTVERAVAGLDALYRQEGETGFYLIAEPGEHHGKVEPLNRMGALAAPLFGLAELTGKAGYASKARAMATTYKQAITRQANGAYSWPYWPAPGRLTGKGERFWKASVSIELALAAYRAGVVFERSDMEAIAAIADRTILVPDGERFLVRRLIDPRSRAYPPAEAVPGNDILAVGSWYAYACFRNGLSATLDRFLFGLDGAFYRSFPRAAWGLAESLDQATDPGRCEAKVAGL
jgi:hypothetical protein